MAGRNGQTISRMENRLKLRRWPSREKSRFVPVDPVIWHVQIAGEGHDTTPILLVHGTGASTHSMDGLFTRLAQDHPVMSIDLPGHGHTEAQPGQDLTLPFMATGLIRLLATMSPPFDKAIIGIGHSAGAAVLMETALRAPERFSAIVGINAALKPMKANAILSPLARMLFLNPFVPQYFAWRAGWGGATRGLLKATGSALNDEQIARYRTLFEDPGHVRGALAMMSAWDLEPLQARLYETAVRTLLLTADDDAFVEPEVSRDAAEKSDVIEWRAIGAGGHLIHETSPDAILPYLADML